MKNMKYNMTFGIALVCVMLFTACDNIIEPPRVQTSTETQTPIENRYGRISISLLGEKTARQSATPYTERTVLPSKFFDKYVYIFTKEGEEIGVEKTPDNEGFFSMEFGSYTVEVQAFTGVTEPYILAASGVSEQFSVGPGDNDPVEILLSKVDTETEEKGKFRYTITYPVDATAVITLQKWTELDDDITLTPADLTEENGISETLELEAGFYLLTVFVSEDRFYAGISEAIHIYPAVTTVYTKDFTDEDMLAATLITRVEISIIAPTNGATPNTTASGSGSSADENFTIGTVSWSPGNNQFLGNTVYTATVTLTANFRCTFNGLSSAEINGQDATVSNNNGAAVTLSYTFPATNEKTVTSIVIKTQPTTLAYTHGDLLDLTGLLVTLAYDDATTEDVAAADFTAKNITAHPAQGNDVVHSTHNGKPVTITYGELPSLSTGNLTVDPKVITFTVDAISNQPYTGSEINPMVTVKDDTTILSLTTDYTVTYANNTEPGTATINITGVGNYAGSTGSVAFTILPPTSVTLNSVIANGSSTQTTTQLTLTFSQAITGLAAGDITLSGVSNVTKGNLSGSGPTYTLGISGFTSGGSLTVSVSKPGYVISDSSKTVTIYYTPPTLTGTVSITGTTQVWQTLTANTTSLGGNGTITYQWKRGTTTNIGSNSSTYTLQPADAGYTITVTVTRAGNSGSVTSSATAAITLSALTGTISITGTAQVGQTLTANTSLLNGSGTPSYQWSKGGTAISGATGSTYTIQSADANNTITVTVTRSGYSGSITSASVSVFSGAVITLPFSTTVEGSITATNTAIRYTVTLAQSGTLTLNLNVPTGTTALPNNGVDVKWYNASSTQISGGTSSGFSFPYTENMNNLAAGTYYIEVIKRGSNVNDGNTGKYSIRVDYYKDEAEPNNTTGNAQVLVPGLTVRGSITSSDIDMYKYVLTEPGRLTMDVTKGTVSYIYVRWYDANGSKIRENLVYYSSDWPYNGYMDLEAGTYYIGIEQYSSSTGTYNLRGDFTAAGNNETEPNNIRQNAQVLTSGQTVKGFISYKDDKDTYKVVLTQPGKLTVNVTKDSASYIYVRWYDVDGNKIRENLVYYSSDWPYNGYMDLEAGTYYIGIEQCSNSTGTYNLKVTW